MKVIRTTSLLLFFSILSCNAENILQLCVAQETLGQIYEESYNNEIRLRAVESKFSQENVNITKCGADYVCLIEKKPVWGTDGKLPRTILSSLVFIRNNHQVSLDVSGMYDPQLNIGLKNRISVHHYWGDSYKVRGKFSDGAGTYYTEWLVNKDGSMRTLINGSESLYETFNFFFHAK